MFDEIYVVTKHSDGDTITTCDNLGVPCLTTDAFGEHFNKGAALNAGLEILKDLGEDWICITDADIFWPLRLYDYLPPLHTAYLYGFYRRVLKKGDIGISGENEWHELLDPIDPLYLGGNYKEFATMYDLTQLLPVDTKARLRIMKPYFELEDPEVFSAMGWNSNVESTLENPLPLGYGQLFSCQEHFDKEYPSKFNTAAGCDSYFSSLWDTPFRKFVPKITTLHLGPRMVHWDGRKVLE